MHRTIVAARPYLIGILSFALGVVIASMAWYKMWTYAAFDPLAGYVGEYADLLEKVNMPADKDDELTSYLWGVSEDLVGLAGMRYESMSAFWRDSLVQDVARIDKLAPEFARVPFDKNWGGYTADRSASVRNCILAVQNDPNANVSTCVQAALSDMYEPASREVAAR